jgi:hypothetical protein
MASVRSNYQKYFRPECENENDAKKGDKQASLHDDDSNEFFEEENDNYNKARQQPRPYYQSKHTT